MLNGVDHNKQRTSVLRVCGLSVFRQEKLRSYTTRSALPRSNTKTTGLFDRRSDDVSLSEVAKIGI